MIDVREIGQEALENLGNKEHCNKLIGITKEFSECDMICNITTNALMGNPLMAIAVVSMGEDEKKALQSLLIYYWEMGRLYGRQEIVDETMGE